MQSAVRSAQATSSFTRLVRERNRFVAALTAVFVVGYFILPVLAGYDRAFLAQKAFGNVTVGYVLAFLEFVMGWALAAVYVVKARAFDRLARQAQEEGVGA